MAPLAPWKRETWHTKVLLVLPMKSAVFSRGTTLQLPPTLRGCYTPHTTLPIASVCVRECLSPHHHGILQERACARWLISTEDTLLPLFFLLYLCFSAPPLLASDKCILFTSLSLKTVAPQLTLTHTEQPFHNQPGLCTAETHMGDPRKALHGWGCYLEILCRCLTGWLSSFLPNAVTVLLKSSMGVSVEFVNKRVF